MDNEEAMSQDKDSVRSQEEGYQSKNSDEVYDGDNEEAYYQVAQEDKEPNNQESNFDDDENNNKEQFEADQITCAACANVIFDQIRSDFPEGHCFICGKRMYPFPNELCVSSFQSTMMSKFCFLDV